MRNYNIGIMLFLICVDWDFIIACSEWECNGTDDAENYRCDFV